MRSVCSWADVPLPAKDIGRRTRDIVPLFDRAAALGVGHLRARIGRLRSERWLASVIKDVRGGRLAPPPETALAVRSEEHTSELQSLMRISYAVFCLKKKKKPKTQP